MACCSCGGAWRGTRPRPGLSANPSTPCARNRCAHLYTKRRLIPTMAAMAVIDTPSATSKIILPRLARPAGTVVARCHASSVRRSAGVRWMVREVLRPRAIQRPCVIQVKTGTNMGFQAFSGKTVREGRQRRHPRWSPDTLIAEKPYAVLDVPARPARDVTVLDSTTGQGTSVSRPWAHVIHRQWSPTVNVPPLKRLEPLAAGATAPSPRHVRSRPSPACPRPPPSPSLRRQTVPGLRSMGAEAVHSVNHTVRLDIWDQRSTDLSVRRGLARVSVSALQGVPCASVRRDA